MYDVISTVESVPANMTNLYDRWLGYIDASPKTIETYTKSIRSFFRYLTDNGIQQPTRTDVIAYRDTLTETHKPTTVQTYLSAVKLFFRWTAQEGLYPNIADRVKSVRIDEEHKKDALTSKQVTKVLAGIDCNDVKGLRDYAILALMATTGLRTVSVVNANVDDIRSLGDDTVLYYKGKGHSEKAAYVKLAEPVEDAIRTYLKMRGTLKGTDPLFSSISNRNAGGRMTTKSVSRLTKEHLKAVNLDSDRLTAHSFRHTAATLNLLNGGTLEETQQLLGHSSINTTMIYAHALERASNNSEARIADAIFA